MSLFCSKVLPKNCSISISFGLFTHTGLSSGNTPISFDANMSTLAGGGYDIDPDLYLPAGTTSGQNMLPAVCDKFVYLEITADMSGVGGTMGQTVYIPCYFN